MANVLVTGANRGIGWELCRQFMERGDQVVAACRETSPELEKLGVRVESGVDVTSDASVRRLHERLNGTLQLDVVVNNAGLLAEEELPELDFDSIRRQFEVNALGPLRVTQTLLPRINRGGKVVIITSRMGSIADNTSGGYYGYRMSKAAVNMASVSLARDLKHRGIAVQVLHPGYVRTRMTDYAGNIDAADSAWSLISRIDELTLETTGTFRHCNGEWLAW
jgi:NAD(P)-dependent dehydrogenase (short-subunit alcohol dehydrogenase family)